MWLGNKHTCNLSGEMRLPSCALSHCSDKTPDTHHLKDRLILVHSFIPGSTGSKHKEEAEVCGRGQGVQPLTVRVQRGKEMLGPRTHLQVMSPSPLPARFHLLQGTHPCVHPWINPLVSTVPCDSVSCHPQGTCYLDTNHNSSGISHIILSLFPR